jgi:RecA-family ATPase
MKDVDFGGFKIAHFNGIMQKEVKPMNWIVPTIVPEGFTLFYGREKLGKSFLVFQVSITVAQGGYVLGKFPVEQTGALYFALEDGERRIYERGKVIAQDGYPESLHIAYDIKDLRNGGKDALNRYLDAYKATKLVTFDIIDRAFATDSRKDHRNEVYDALKPLQELASQRAIGIIAVHHANRGDDKEDWLDTVYQNGYGQVADTIVRLNRRRGNRMAQLQVTGRDVQEHEYNLVWSPEALTWTITGDKIETEVPETLSEIDRLIQAIKKYGNKAQCDDIAKDLDKPRYTVDNNIRRAKDAGRLTSDSGCGHFYLIPPDQFPIVAA